MGGDDWVDYHGDDGDCGGGSDGGVDGKYDGYDDGDGGEHGDVGGWPIHSPWL